MARAAIFLALVPLLAACTPFPSDQRRMESAAELQAKQESDFAALPVMKLPELRQRLHALGVTDSNMSTALDDYDEPMLMLRFTPAEFERLDLRALGRLELDSLYRFRMVDPSQSHDLALYSGSEGDVREQAIALNELAEKGEMERFPRYVPGHSMTIYARQLEAYCGYGPGDALRVIDGKWLEYNQQMTFDAAMDGANGKGAADFHCVRRIVYATDLRHHFIGNRRPGAIRT